MYTQVRLHYFLPFLHCVLTQQFYFATHNSYAGNVGFANVTILEIIYFSKGSRQESDQACRRKCGLDSRCQAFETFKHLTDHPAEITCRLLNNNLCSWQTVTLTNQTGQMSKVIMEKIPSTLQPKACVEFLAVKYKGNCTAARGVVGLDGLNCDENAPRLCADYVKKGLKFMPVDLAKWIGKNANPIWPYGFYGRKVMVRCAGNQTEFFHNMYMGPYSKTRYVNAVNWPEELRFLNQSDFLARVGFPFEFPLLSDMVAASAAKQLFVQVTTHDDWVYRNKIWFNFTYTDFELSPQGELSLGALLNNASYPIGFESFPLPLKNAPFLYDTTCGPFWIMPGNTQGTTCNQSVYLINNDGIKWGTTPVPVQTWITLSII